MDPEILLVTTAAGLVATVLCGLAPALSATRVNVAADPKENAGPPRGESPIGRRFWLGRTRTGQPIDIVGVVGDATFGSLRAAAPPTAYGPYAHSYDPSTGMVFEIRVAGDPLSLVPAARQIVAGLLPGVPLADVKTQARQIEGSLGPETTAVRLFTLFGAIALLLAAVGVHGTMVIFFVAAVTTCCQREMVSTAIGRAVSVCTGVFYLTRVTEEFVLFSGSAPIAVACAVTGAVYVALAVRARVQPCPAASGSAVMGRRAATGTRHPSISARGRGDARNVWASQPYCLARREEPPAAAAPGSCPRAPPEPDGCGECRSPRAAARDPGTGRFPVKRSLRPPPRSWAGPRRSFSRPRACLSHPPTRNAFREPTDATTPRRPAPRPA